MDFDVSIDEHAEVYSIIVVRGEVDLHTAPKVQYAIERASESGASESGASDAVILDMSGISFMDSTALSMFARCKDSLGGRGVSLRFVSPSRAVERIFSVTGFREYFEVFPTREAALPTD